MKSYHEFLVAMQQPTADIHSRKDYFEESFGYRKISGNLSPVSCSVTTVKSVIVNVFLPSMLHF